MKRNSCSEVTGIPELTAKIKTIQFKRFLQKGAVPKSTDP